MRTFFGGNATITPTGIIVANLYPSNPLITSFLPDFDESTPVVVAELNNAQAGTVFGVSKIKNGNRMETVHLANMVVVFYPPTGKASCWVSV